MDWVHDHRNNQGFEMSTVDMAVVNGAYMDV